MKSISEVDVSIVITNYNRCQFLARAIRSCLDQIVFRRRIEIIIVDDGSTDGSVSLLNQFADMHEIKLIFNKKNMGVAAASNIGLDTARGRYWIRVDSDDFLNRMAINYMADVLDHNSDIGYIYADHYRVDDIGFKQTKVKLDNEKVLFEHGAGVMFRTEVLKNLGGYVEEYKNCEDYDLLLKVTKNSKGFYLPLPLYRYHIHGDNISMNDERDKFKAIVEKKHGI